MAHSILVAAYEMMRASTDFKGLGGDYLDQFAKKRAEKHLVGRLEALGYESKAA